ncbi:penicillin-binding protein [Chryseobacterium sp. T16E-39]|nr:penicillin-binding protein [Chryseobacterium sp. T16E-39]ASK31949.1 penicillin-binding protein [Chryseobacterium sp. T16E-39]
MTKQSAHINVNLCDCPILKGSFGYEWTIWNEAKCADFGNYLL